MENAAFIRDKRQYTVEDLPALLGMLKHLVEVALAGPAVSSPS